MTCQTIVTPSRIRLHSHPNYVCQIASRRQAVASKPFIRRCFELEPQRVFGYHFPGFTASGKMPLNDSPDAFSYG
jgi:hypothetical protein